MAGAIVPYKPNPALNLPKGAVPGSVVTPQHGTTIYTQDGVMVGAKLGSTGQTIMQGALVAIEGASLLPKTSLPTALVSALAGTALTLGVESFLKGSSPSVPAPYTPPPIVPSSYTAPRIPVTNVSNVNSTTVNAINNFSPTIENTIVVKPDSSLIALLAQSAIAQTQAITLQTAVQNAQLGMLNEQVFGFLAYADLMLNIQNERNTILGGLIPALYDTAPLPITLPDNSIVASALGLVGAGLTDMSTSIGSNFSKDISTIADASKSSKVITEYLQKPVSIIDLDGKPVVTMSPMEIKTANDATTARKNTDINNDEFTADDFPSMPDIFPLLQFAGRADVFNQKNPIIPTNVFSPTSGMGD